VVLTPPFMPSWNFAIDYYEIELTGNIGEIDSSRICFDPANASHVFCDNIVRDPASGNVVEQFDLFNNRAFASTSGIDVQIHYLTDLPDGLSLFGDIAEFSIHLIWKNMLDVDSQENAVSSLINCTGYFGSPCRGDFGTTAVEDRIATSFQYSSGPLDLTLSSHWIGGTKNWGQVDHLYFGGPEANLAIPSIGSENFLNLGIGYEFNDSFAARLNVANLLDQDAPFMADGAFANNTDNLLYDIYGRAYSLSLTFNIGD
jgi:outer membrane receptor protein involved in Fe transport